MSDIKARLAEALFPYLLYPSESQKVADVLLALPGIAVVELPPVTIERDTYRSWLFTEAGEVESVTYPASDGEIAVSGVGTYTPSEAMVFAGALLAAALLAAAAAVQAQEEQQP